MSRQPPTTPPTKAPWRDTRPNLPFSPEQENEDEDHHFPIPSIDDTTNTITSTSFSPSKARAQARQTHQLTLLKSWLSSLLETTDTTTTQTSQHHHHGLQVMINRWESEYLGLTNNNSSTNPTLAAEVLRTFQDLMFANRSSDERRRLIHEAQVEELELLLLMGGSSSKSMTMTTTNNSTSYSNATAARNLIDRVHENLSPHARENLKALAESAVLLDCLPQADSSKSLVGEMGEVLMRRTVDSQVLQNNIVALSTLRDELRAGVDKNETQLQVATNTRQWEDVEGEKMQFQTAQWNREMKQISMKMQEYKDRIATLERTRPGRDDHNVTKLEDVIILQDRVKKRQEIVKVLEDRVKALHGLPSDLEASRQEVRRAQIELEQWRSKREGLFANTTRQ